jgi:enterochelin esterase-like enzyme
MFERLTRSRRALPLALSVLVLLVVGGLSYGAPGSGDAASLARAAARVERGSFYSPALRGQAHYSVYLPRGYGLGRKRYPVIYFLHGLPGAGSSYAGERVARLGRAVDRSGHAAIVVGAQGARAGDSDPEWHDWGPGRNWETATAVDLTRYIDGHYRTIADRAGRALVGLSAGGYGAALIGFHRPATYSVVESWSGYFHPTTPSGDGPLSVGSDHDNRLASAHTYVRKALAIYRRNPTFLAFYVGDLDARFRKENELFDRELDAAGVPHVFELHPGSHSGAFWDEHEDDWIVTALAHLAAAR